MIAQAPTRKTTFSRLAILALTVTATLAAYLPVAGALDRPILLVVVTGLAVFGTLIGFPSRQRASTYKPTFAEFTLAAVNETTTMAFLGLLTIALYYAFYWGVRGANDLWALGWDPRSIPFYLASALSSFPLLGLIVSMVDEVSKLLYPETAGVPSAYYELAKHRKRSIILWTLLGLGYLAFATVTSLLSSKESDLVLSILFLLYLLFGSFWLRPRVESPVRAADAIGVLMDGLKALGFSVIPYPRTGRPEVDPLLTEVDLFAHRGEQAFAIGIRGPSDQEMAKWTAGTGVVQAARALKEPDLPDGVAVVSPVLVLVNAWPDSSLLAFATAESVALVPIKSSDDAREVAERLSVALLNEQRSISSKEKPPGDQIIGEAP